MVDVRHAARQPDGVDIALEDVEERRAFLRIHFRLDIEAVDVNRLVAEAVRDFLALDEQKLIVLAVEGIQRVDRRQDVVVAQHEKLISVLAIPPGHHVRRAVAVTLGRVRVGIAFVPPRGRLLLTGERRRDARCRHERDEQDRD